MNKGNRIVVFLFAAMLMSHTGAYSQGFFGLFKKKKTAAVVKKDSVPEKKSDLKAYSEIITKEAVTKEGLFKVHKVKKDYFFEIPKSLLSRQFLIVNKLSGVPDKLNDAGINRGVNYQNTVISFELDTVINKVFVRQEKPFVECPEEDGIYLSVKENFRSSVIDVFDLETYSKDTSAFVIKVNKIYNGNKKSFNNVFGTLGLGTSAKTDFSRILNIKSFPNNIVAKSELTSNVPGDEFTPTMSVLVTSSLVLLPETPMKPRFADERVGFFSNRRWYFNDKQHKLEKRQLVNRWRLEPKEEDVEKYLHGELVEPKKPIVYYVDPGTPRQWISYIKQGIEEWQVAFEQAGFKNAIIAKDAPVNDPDFDPDDVRFSVVTYAASPKKNAMGPSVIDPRSGEILEADIVWWHNVMISVHEWMRVQTGVIDPKSRANTFTEEHMGDAIRFVSSHEVGHTLGLMHNMAASNAYPVDSLRSKTFTDRVGGTAPSIMDYARFNYVAQPGDGVKKITPVIGTYDKYAIDWAYRYIDTKTPHEELATLNRWIVKHNGDPLYRYGQQQKTRTAVDPTSQSEDVGDNSMKAAEYGLKNMKVLMKNALKWSAEDGLDYMETGKLYHGIISQWTTFNTHVITNVGGIYLRSTVSGDNTNTYNFVEKARQKEAISYLVRNVFTCPQWLFNPDFQNKVWAVKDTPVGPQQYAPISMYSAAISFAYWDLLERDRLLRMYDNERLNDRKAYKVTEMFDDLYKGIFKNTIRGRKLNQYERINQKSFVDALMIAVNRGQIKIDKRRLRSNHSATSRMPMLCDLGCRHHFDPAKEAHAKEEHDHSIVGRKLNFVGAKRVNDDVSIKRGTLVRIRKLLKSRLAINHIETKYHYEDLISRIDKILSK